MSKIVHMELNTSDPKGAKHFYKRVFGWKYQEMPMPGGAYTMVSGDDGPIGGIQQNPMPGPSSWLGYVGVKSLKRTVAKVEKAGGKTLTQAEVPGQGKLAVFLDPQGAMIACWEQVAAPKKPARKSAKKKSAKRSAKKKASKKRPAKKAAKKKVAKKRPAKKAAKKKVAKKRPAKKKAKKRAAKRKR